MLGGGVHSGKCSMLGLGYSNYSAQICLEAQYLSLLEVEFCQQQSMTAVMNN